MPRLSTIAVLGAFGVGVVLGAAMLPGSAGRTVEPPLERAALRDLPPPTLRTGYPAEVLRVFDGDTFEARVRIWPGHDVTTRVRLRSIDAPEMKARCDDERMRAVAARDALARLLDEGAVAISAVGIDKYGGRVDADVSTARTRDVGQALLDGGHARACTGGRRQSWCEVAR